jgi:hypothetical protein
MMFTPILTYILHETNDSELRISDGRPSLSASYPSPPEQGDSFSKPYTHPLRSSLSMSGPSPRQSRPRAPSVRCKRCCHEVHPTPSWNTDLQVHHVTINQHDTVAGHPHFRVDVVEMGRVISSQPPRSSPVLVSQIVSGLVTLPTGCRSICLGWARGDRIKSAMTSAWAFAFVAELRNQRELGVS